MPHPQAPLPRTLYVHPTITMGDGRRSSQPDYAHSGVPVGAPTLILSAAGSRGVSRGADRHVGEPRKGAGLGPGTRSTAAHLQATGLMWRTMSSRSKSLVSSKL